MALAAAVAGAVRPSQTITWLRDDGEPEVLTGATLTGKIRNPSTGTTRAIAGSLVIVNGAAGQFRWDYDPADVADAGEQQVQFTASFASNPTPARTITEEWVVYEALG